jgi:type IV pilus assembly protein PilV
MSVACAAWGMAARPAGAGERGFNMLEVLISLLILGIGLLGLASLQVVGLQNNQSAYMRSQATVLSYQILDSMRGNRPAAVNQNYDWNFEFPGPANPDNTAERDLQTWLNNLDVLLPEGRGRVEVDADGRVTVEVRWLDQLDEDEVANQRRSFVLRTEI